MDNVTKGLCYYSYVGPFWLLGLFSPRKKDETLRFHMNQGMVLFIFEIIAVLICTTVSRLFISSPVTGWLIQSVLAMVALICAICLALQGMFNVARDRKHRLPVIGKLTIIK